MYLTVDIGGTKIEMALGAVLEGKGFRATASPGPIDRPPSSRLDRSSFSELSCRVELHEISRLATASVATLSEALKNYLGDRRPKMIVIGLAGPVFGRRVKLTNVAFEVDADLLEKEFGCPVVLMNDLEAHGWGISLLQPEDLKVLQEGHERTGHRALIAAGTGLGEAILFWDGEDHRPSPSEGGHATFAPQNLQDLDFARFMLTRFEHVSWERVVSGIDGFQSIFSYLYQTKIIQIPEEIADELLREPSLLGPKLSRHAHEGDLWAIKVVECFVRYYGAEAGNLALKAMAVGGVYIGGSIVHHLMPWVESGLFKEAFVAKGRFRSLLSEIPIRVIKEPYTALKGGAYFGHRLMT